MPTFPIANALEFTERFIEVMHLRGGKLFMHLGPSHDSLHNPVQIKKAYVSQAEAQGSRLGTMV